MDTIEEKYGIVYAKKTKLKSVLRIGQDKALIIQTDAVFNKLQKRMWKLFFNIDIENMEE